MDQETARLAVTASATLVGALSGAGITALFNRMNTRDTIDATAASKDIEYTELRQREHESWLRDQRQIAYAEFLAIAQSVISAAEKDIEGKLGDHKLDDLPVLMARLRLVGTATPVDRAEAMAQAADLVVGLRKQMDTATDETLYKRDESWIEMTRLVGVFRMKAKEYIEAVRDDLETGSNEVGPLPDREAK